MVLPTVFHYVLVIIWYFSKGDYSQNLSIFCRWISSCAANSGDSHSGGQLKLPQAEHRGGLSSRHSALQVINYPLLFLKGRKPGLICGSYCQFPCCWIRIRIRNIAYFFLTQGCCGTGAAGDCEHPPGE